MKRTGKLVLMASVAVAACSDSRAPTGIEPPPVEPSIEDAVHNDGNEHFYWLPPLVSAVSYGGTFDLSVSPIVTICQLSGSACDPNQPNGFPLEYSMTSGPGGETVSLDAEAEQYQVKWHTDVAPLDVDEFYRIEVRVGTQVLGHADVDPVATGNELKNVDTNELIALKDGRTLPIMFRIEEGAVGIVIDDPLVAHWKFDEAGGTLASDATGRGNDGTLVGDVTFTSGGILGGVAHFGSGDGRIEVPKSADVDFGTEDYTITLWFRTTLDSRESVLYNTRNTVSCSQATGPGQAGNLESPNFAVSGGGRSNADVAYKLVGTTPANDGSWHHFALVRSGTTMRLYLDGVLEDQASLASGESFLTTRDFWIGRSHYCSGGPFEGDMDDFRIYNGGLDAGEVEALATLTAN